MYISDTTVGNPSLGSVDHPFVIGFVVHRASTQRGNIRSRVGFAHAERTQLHIVGGAVTLRHPFDGLLWSSVTTNTCCGQTRSHNRHTDTGVTPEDFFNGNWQGETTWITHGIHHEFNAVQTNLGCFLHDRPWELFTVVPLLSVRADVFNGKLMNPVLDLQLIVIEVH
ncbi:unannotated protein [freshwater metagenome]|uniref:Unannotated protein n=1 Tax=freshwater metagenome TaxID=449393 RepID=A0A6J7W2I5_9ZZZZ